MPKILSINKGGRSQIQDYMSPELKLAHFPVMPVIIMLLFVLFVCYKSKSRGKKIFLGHILFHLK